MALQNTPINVPNMLSVFRGFSAFFIVFLIINGFEKSAFYLFIIATISDALDGWIARSFKSESLIGAALDPIADKIFICVIYIFFSFKGLLPIWMTLFIVFRDIAIVGVAGYKLMIKKPIKIAPIILSKINTMFQFALAMVILGKCANFWSHSVYEDILFTITVGTTFCSAIAYAFVAGIFNLND